MGLLMFESNGMMIRVREEDFGCIVFSGDAFYAEGNKTVFQILCMVQQGLTKAAICTRLAGEYELPEQFMARELDEFLEALAPLGLLQDLK